MLGDVTFFVHRISDAAEKVGILIRMLQEIEQVEVGVPQPGLFSHDGLDLFPIGELALEGIGVVHRGLEGRVEFSLAPVRAGQAHQHFQGKGPFGLAFGRAVAVNGKFDVGHVVSVHAGVALDRPAIELLDDLVKLLQQRQHPINLVFRHGVILLC